MRTLNLSVLLVLLVLQARPQAGKPNFALTVDNIMRGPGLVGYEPAAVRWSYDSEWLYFQWKQYGDKETSPLDTYVVKRDGSGLRKLTGTEIKQLPPTFGDTSKDKRLTTYSNAGDLFVYDNTTGQTQQLTRTTDAEANPHFTHDGKRIYFTRSNNLYVMSLDNGMLVQLTDIRAAGAPAPAPPAGGGGRGFGGRGATAPPTTGDQPPRGTDSQEYLKKVQKELLEAVRDRAAIREELEKKRQSENPRKPFTLQPRQSVGALQLTPDEKYVIASVSETAATPAKNTIVPNYVTESAYTEDIPGRSNVGDTQAAARLAIINVESGEVKWAEHGQKRVAPAGETGQRTESGKEVGADTLPRPPASADRDVQLGLPIWSEDGAKAVISARAADNKDRWILALDPATGKTRVLVDIHDNAWVGGPQGTANILGWMKNDREVFFQSEKTGYSHLYAVAFDGGEPRALTSGNWEVLDARQSRDKSKFYLTASAEGPFDQHLYEMGGDGNTLTRLSTLPGKHTATYSPDERWVADIYSYTNKPPDLYVQENRPRVDETRLTTSPSPEFSQYKWQDVPIVKVPARDGVPVPARLFKPANFKKGGPAVVFVHGAGYLQNVDHKWSTYYHEYLFDHILMDRGFLVIDVDYRGSAGYGRDWRTAVYEHMGGKDLDDIVDAARYVVAQHGVDPKKIGVFGGSYGGFITLMAMFTQPDVFAAGAALRPVSDWALYNHGYTSNILNTPQADAEAYRKSSPIFFAEGLKGALLICHGMVDTNVEFQDTVRLVQRLIELRKPNWSLAVYPVEDHGFVQPTSWADEYKRILALFEKNLK
jgi:dipeptidyl aminopeptidase/acylaminoacyl peptidase